jgi:adenylyl cyclase-associated protein
MASPIYVDLIKDLQEEMTKTDDIRQNNRGSPQKDHLAMVADGVGALGWITDSKPAEYVVELFGGAQIFGNKILKEYKDRCETRDRCTILFQLLTLANRDNAQVEWVRSFYKLMRSLISYIKEHYIKGLQWNTQGMDAADALRQVQSSPNGTAPGFGSAAPPPSPMPAGGIPPPPGPPPPPSLGGPPKATAPDMGAVFEQLNQGEAVTKGLKKVDPSQQTHKNPSLRTQAPVPARSNSRTSLRGKSPTPPGKKPKPESMRAKKPPRRELDGNKWIIVSTSKAAF